MLERSKKEWFAASSDEKAAAETMARSYLISELEQNLISTDKATRIVEARMAERDEEWSRAVYGMLVGLRQVGTAVGRRPPTSNAPAPPDCTLHDEFLHDAKAGVADLR